MVENKVKDGNYYVIQSFMVNELHLKGLERDVYAIIYGFSQSENQRFGFCRLLFAKRKRD